MVAIKSSPETIQKKGICKFPKTENSIKITLFQLNKLKRFLKTPQKVFKKQSKNKIFTRAKC